MPPGRQRDGPGAQQALDVARQRNALEAKLEAEVEDKLTKFMKLREAGEAISLKQLGIPLDPNTELGEERREAFLAERRGKKLTDTVITLPSENEARFVLEKWKREQLRRFDAKLYIDHSMRNMMLNMTPEQMRATARRPRGVRRLWYELVEKVLRKMPSPAYAVHVAWHAFLFYGSIRFIQRLGHVPMHAYLPGSQGISMQGVRTSNPFVRRVAAGERDAMVGGAASFNAPNLTL